MLYRRYLTCFLVLVTLAVGARFWVDDWRAPGAAHAPSPTSQVQGTLDVTATDLEAEYQRGNRSLAVVTALSDQRAAKGSREGAIELMRAYVTAHPEEVAGRKKLAEHYSFAARYAEVRDQYEEIIKRELTEENLQVLLDLYGAENDLGKQISTLERMVQVSTTNKPSLYGRLASLQLQAGSRDQSRATLATLAKQFPDASAFEIIRARAALMLADQQAKEAFMLIQQWVSQQAARAAATPEELSKLRHQLGELAQMLIPLREFANAIALIKPHEDWLSGEPTLAQAYVDALMGSQQPEEAYRVMVELDNAKSLWPDLYVPYIKLIATRATPEQWKGTVWRLDTTQFNEWQAINTIKAAHESNATTLLSLLAEKFSDPSILVVSPVLNAYIAAESGASADAKKRIDQALKADLQPFQRNLLAQLCTEQKHEACLDALTAQFPPASQMNEVQLNDYVQLHLMAGRAAAALKQLTQSPAGVSGAAFDRFRLMLAAAAGDSQLVASQIASPAMPTSQLREAFYLADNNGQYPTAVRIAETLYRKEPIVAHRDILVASYVAAREDSKWLAFLKAEAAHDPAREAGYINALVSLSTTHAEAKSALVEQCQKTLQAANGDEATQLNCTYVLINNGKHAEALAFVNRMAPSRGGEWAKILQQLHPSSVTTP